MKVDIGSNNGDLILDDIREMLSSVFWSPNIGEAEILKGIENSALVVGAYAEGAGQVGFLRVVSDKVRFAYIMDVVVHEDCRRQGIGRRMVNYALAHPELKDVYQWFLITRDAHGVYEECGFKPLEHPEEWMSMRLPRPDRTNFIG